MSTRVPIIQMISWWRFAAVLLIAVCILGIGWAAAGLWGVIIAGCALEIYLVGARFLIARQHRAAVRKMRSQDFDLAIPLCRKSFEFFDGHLWIDQYRCITMLSISAISYREMALANAAFCHAQLGNGIEAKQAYEECLKRFPQSALATAALRMLDAGRQTEGKCP